MPRNFLKIHSPVSLGLIIMATQDFKTFSALFGSKSNQVALKEEELVKTEGDCEMGGDAKKLLEESKILLKEAEKKEEEVRKVVKQNIHADTADKIEERLDEVKAMIGKVTSKSGEVKELVQTGKPAGMASDVKEGQKEVLVSKDMKAAEAEVPDSKKRYLSKLGIQQEIAKPKVTEDAKKPEVMKMPVVTVEEAAKTPEANKLTEDVVKVTEVKEEVELKVEAFHQPEVKKPDVKEAVKKPEVPEAAKKPEVKKEVKKPEVTEAVKRPVVKEEGKKLEVTEAVQKPKVKEAVKKTEAKEEVKKPEVTEAVKKPEVKEYVNKTEAKEEVKKTEAMEVVKKPEVTEAVIEVKKTVEKPEVKEASEAQGADIVMPEVKKVKVEESMEVKVAALKGRELAPTCDVITIGEEEPEVKLEASVPIEVPVVEDFLSAADVEESDVSCDEEDIGWDSEKLAWAMGSDAEMRPKNRRQPQDQVGINYIAVAIDVATEKLAGYRLIQVGLSAADWLLGAIEEATTAELAPYVATVRRNGRKVRRSGEKQTGAVRPAGMLTDAALAVASTLRIGTVLQLFGWKIQPVNQTRFKKVSAADSDEDASYLLEDLDSSDYNSDLDADYLPEEETVDTEEERLEFCSDIESCSTTED